MIRRASAAPRTSATPKAESAVPRSVTIKKEDSRIGLMVTRYGAPGVAFGVALRKCTMLPC